MAKKKKLMGGLGPEGPDPLAEILAAIEGLEKPATAPAAAPAAAGAARGPAGVGAGYAAALAAQAKELEASKPWVVRTAQKAARSKAGKIAGGAGRVVGFGVNALMLLMLAPLLYEMMGTRRGSEEDVLAGLAEEGIAEGGQYGLDRNQLMQDTAFNRAYGAVGRIEEQMQRRNLYASEELHELLAGREAILRMASGSGGKPSFAELMAKAGNL